MISKAKIAKSLFFSMVTLLIAGDATAAGGAGAAVSNDVPVYICRQIGVDDSGEPIWGPQTQEMFPNISFKDWRNHMLTTENVRVTIEGNVPDDLDLNRLYDFTFLIYLPGH